MIHFQSALLLCMLNAITAFQSHHSSTPFTLTISRTFLSSKSNHPSTLFSRESTCKLGMAPSSSEDKKKKRRRRKKQEKVLKDTDELPDFDLPDFDLNEESSETTSVDKQSMTMNELPTDAELSLGSVSSMSSMQASPVQGTSIKGLLRTRDRSVESTFEFDDVANPLPRPTSKTTTSNPLSSASDDFVIPEGMSKKRAKSEARKAAAIEAAKLQEEEESSPFSFINSIPFLKDVQDTSPVKLLEYGAWTGIFLLVAWEVFINSPFFERAAPMAPVVY